MPSNSFNASNPAAKPPAYCHFDPTPLPIIPFGAPPPLLSGWARWTDLDPEFPIDVAMFIKLARDGVLFRWYGAATMNRITLTLTLERITDPNPWRVSLAKRWNHLGHEVLDWDPVTMQLEPTYDTGALTSVNIPGYDYRQARVMA